MTAEFTSALSTLVGSDGPPLLLTGDGAAHMPLRTVEEVVASGEQLEHLHAYARPPAASISASAAAAASAATEVAHAGADGRHGEARDLV